ncbi:SIR2 family protein [Paradesulfitobacterium ferrireducens]|uniref:SIR2 family protein n=1 Tax=Paradesulfitobacterium ferrireducens TaxID=2816476 RepID=UPI001A8FC59A|nr:SIR2 family protein [Paradesulfitobacterium ferrireducens]
MNAKISDIVKKFATTPFLFVGSGLTRRYYNLPAWRGLLEIFARRVKDDDFAYMSYESKAKASNPQAGLYPKVAELIENDFNEKWFTTPAMRQLNEAYLKEVKEGVSPFKAEIAMYIQSHSGLVGEYRDEVEKLRTISKNSISGIITTNYDRFLESVTDNYACYIGQEQLVFSAIQGIAEIYKIHGSTSQPDSIVINEVDYLEFDKRSAYLAAKLMTIFLEYPIIFLGYSIGDPNIQKILKAIVECLSVENAKKLENRFVFIEYEKGFGSVEIAPHTMTFDGKMISMTKIKLENFALLYDALAEKKTKLPVKLLRMFKQEFYNYVLTNTPTANLRVAGIDDTRVEDEELVLAIGKATDFGLKGLKGLTSNEWYRDIVMDDLEFTADELLEFAYPSIIVQTNRLPLNKYLSQATKDFPRCREDAAANEFENIISNSIKKYRHRVTIPDRSVKGIIADKQNSFEKATRLIAHLEQNEINVDDLESYLKSIFLNNENILEMATTAEKTNLRRLIRIYDYLKFAQK